MELLTTLAATDGDIDDSAFLAYGGLVDRQTAAAEDVVLWSDPVTSQPIASAMRPAVA